MQNNDGYPWRVMYLDAGHHPAEARDPDAAQLWTCMADDIGHAIEQCLDAYPGATIVGAALDSQFHLLPEGEGGYQLASGSSTWITARNLSIHLWDKDGDLLCTVYGRQKEMDQPHADIEVSFDTVAREAIAELHEDTPLEEYVAHAVHLDGALVTYLDHYERREGESMKDFLERCATLDWQDGPDSWIFPPASPAATSSTPTAAAPTQ
ncbi:MAG: hypothetical protein A2580_09175 [Hydrogenophilales bacterium RIFOXYD1_FULL_62_11]|nr:MAG: hypothetical protein A2580_09175 [Hydrogenophilales bacterium RIFOXYD1_FULL_62_11]